MTTYFTSDTHFGHANKYILQFNALLLEDAKITIDEIRKDMVW
jgi:calcineurin-like phosphoesterase family protein